MTTQTAHDIALAEHPAVVAAIESGLARPTPSSVDALLDSKKSAVYRLGWAEPHLAPVIVKRCTDGLGQIERLLYERLLPDLPIRSLRCYGSFEQERGRIWLTLEDAGDHEPSFESGRWREAATRFLAAIHAAGAGLDTGSGLPDRGPDHFANRLRAARAQLETRLAGESDLDDRDILLRGIERCDVLESFWPRVEEICARYPRTLVHGDFVEENLRVVAEPRPERLVPLDWEKAGCGVPAVDLVRVVPDLYWRLTRRRLGGTRREFDELVLVGMVFRVLVHRWTGKSIRKARDAAARLDELMTSLEWQRPE